MDAKNAKPTAIYFPNKESAVAYCNEIVVQSVLGIGWDIMI